MNKKNNKGFSLIELVIVITIMVILTALLAPQLLRYVEQSRAAKDAVTMDEATRAIELALTNENVYKEVAASIPTIQYTATAGLTVSAGTHLPAELVKTLGTLADLPDLVSKTYTDKAPLAIVIKSTGDGFSVTATKP